MERQIGRLRAAQKARKSNPTCRMTTARKTIARGAMASR